MFTRAKFRAYLATLQPEWYPTKDADQPNEIAACMQYSFAPTLRAYLADPELYNHLASASEGKGEPLTAGECLGILCDLEYA